MSNSCKPITRLYQMYRHYLPISEIASRSGYSERQVRRKLKDFLENMPDSFTYDRDVGRVRSVARIIRQGDEHKLWRYYKKCGYSYGKIALAFGRTRQAVQKKLTETETKNVA